MSGFELEHLRELSSFRDLEAITDEVKAITSTKVDTDDRASLEKRLQDIDRLAQLDIKLAQQAFRVELVEVGNDFLPIASRVSLIEGFEPTRLEKQAAAHQSDVADLERMRQREPWRYQQTRNAISIGGISMASRPHPLGIASSIESGLLDIQEKIKENAPGVIGFRVGNEFFAGIVEDESALSFVEPTVTRKRGKVVINNVIPTRLHGITTIERTIPYGKKEFDPTEYGDLFSEVDGQIVAHPSLERVNNALGLRPQILLDASPVFGATAVSAGTYNTGFDRDPPRRNHGLIRTPDEQKRTARNRRRRGY